MQSAAACTLLVVVWLACANASSVSYTYEDQSAWNTLSDSMCGGTRQSPIDISTEQLQDGRNFGLKELDMSNWGATTRGTWLNNGHTVQYMPDNAATITTETYLGQYNLVQLHFHWGPNDTVGSEHLVNGAPYSGELHFVHQAAVMPADAGNTFTVVGVLLRADPSLALTGTVWEKLVDTIPMYDENTTINDIVLREMLPMTLSYYYYNGSLTTPLCDEVVQWALLRTPVNVPAMFFDRLRTMTYKNAANDAALEINYRDVQPLNDREVYALNVQPVQSPPQTSPTPTPDSASPTTSTFALLLLVVLAALLFV